MGKFRSPFDRPVHDAIAQSYSMGHCRLLTRLSEISHRRATLRTKKSIVPCACLATCQAGHERFSAATQSYPRSGKGVATTVQQNGRLRHLRALHHANTASRQKL